MLSSLLSRTFFFFSTLEPEIRNRPEREGSGGLGTKAGTRERSQLSRQTHLTLLEQGYTPQHMQGHPPPPPAPHCTLHSGVQELDPESLAQPLVRNSEAAPHTCRARKPGRAKAITRVHEAAALLCAPKQHSVDTCRKSEPLQNSCSELQV